MSFKSIYPFKRSLFLILTLILSSSSAFAVIEKPEPALPEINQIVMDIVRSYPTDGTHDYWWPKTNEYDGATTDIYCLDNKVMRGETGKHAFCCGLTLEVFYKTLNKIGDKKDATPKVSLISEKFKHFQFLWFCPDLYSPGPGLALETYGIGKILTNPEDALPGDFVQYWRNNKSGHSVIFIDWIKNQEGKITQLKYWSTQKKTKGIGYNVEPVGDNKDDITLNKIFISRLLLPNDWKNVEIKEDMNSPKE